MALGQFVPKVFPRPLDPRGQYFSPFHVILFSLLLSLPYSLYEDVVTWKRENLVWLYSLTAVHVLVGFNNSIGQCMVTQ
jgi:hypothetical protein